MPERSVRDEAAADRSVKDGSSTDRLTEEGSIVREPEKREIAGTEITGSDPAVEDPTKGSVTNAAFAVDLTGQIVPKEISGDHDPLTGDRRAAEARSRVTETRRTSLRGTELSSAFPSPSLSKVEPAAVPPLREARGVVPERFIEHVAREVQLTVEEGRSEMVMRLDPPDLGRLHVRLTTEAGVVAASFHSESEGVRTLLETHLPALQTALNDAGIQVQQFTVLAGMDFGRFGQPSGQPPADRQPASPRRSGSRNPSSERTVEAVSSSGAGIRSTRTVDFFA
jgi:flagellar hook-length control protein FliK